ncbi:MAG: PHP domain-containing protein [Caldilineaceae bacterium]
MERLLYESHMHTPLCKHARGNPTEYAAVAWERGLKGIVVTCHNLPVDGWSPRARMAEDRFDTYVELIEEARAQWTGRGCTDVRMGLECDFVPGMEQAIVLQLAGRLQPRAGRRASPVARLQGALRHRRPQVALQHTYFEHLALVAETGLFDTIAPSRPGGKNATPLRDPPSCKIASGRR